MIYLKLLTVAFIWGGTFITTRIAAQALPPFSGALLRFAFAAVGLLVVVFWKGKSSLSWPDRRLFWYTLAIAGSGIIAYNYFFFSALKLIPASRASLLVALNPVLVLFGSALFFDEKLRFTKIIGGLLALAGAVVVISRGHPERLFEQFGLGEALALGCPLTWAIYTLLNRQIAGQQSPLTTTTLSVLFGTLGLLPLAWLEGAPLTGLSSEVWVSLAYLGLLGTVLGFVWYAEGIREIGATRTAIFNNLVPVFGVILSVLLLGEQVGWPVLAGGALVIAGVAVINFL